MLHRNIKPIEGNLIQDSNNIIFDVKGIVHPPKKVVAFPRFIPDPSGNRKHKGIIYKKVYALSARFKLLEQHFSHYIVFDPVFDAELCEVPLADVKRHYEPVNRLKELRSNCELDELEADALEFMELLKDYTKVPWNALGISGSLLVKLHMADSDIDPIVYGSKNCQRVYNALAILMRDKENTIKSYSKSQLRKLFRFRVKDTKTSSKDFMKTESRKVLQGKFKGRDYFLRFIKDWSEIETEYGVICYKNVGYARIKAEIEDDSEAIFTPCSYRIRKVKVLEGKSLRIEEIASFRGRFCEQARKGEWIVAQGKVEKVIDGRQNREYFRLLLGNKPSDYMVLT